MILNLSCYIAYKQETYYQYISFQLLQALERKSFSIQLNRQFYVKSFLNKNVVSRESKIFYRNSLSFDRDKLLSDLTDS